jgi:hypothetical protein
VRKNPYPTRSGEEHLPDTFHLPTLTTPIDINGLYQMNVSARCRGRGRRYSLPSFFTGTVSEPYATLPYPIDRPHLADFLLFLICTDCQVSSSSCTRTTGTDRSGLHERGMEGLGCLSSPGPPRGPCCPPPQRLRQLLPWLVALLPPRLLLPGPCWPRQRTCRRVCSRESSR